MGMDQGRGGGVADQDNPDPDLSHRKKPELDSTLEKKNLDTQPWFMRWVSKYIICAGLSSLDGSTFQSLSLNEFAINIC